MIIYPATPKFLTSTDKLRTIDQPFPSVMANTVTAVGPSITKEISLQACL